VNLGVDSYRYGKAYFMDPATGVITDKDPGWSKGWEATSHARGNPKQVQGWKAGDTGSKLVPPAYQKLEGAWKNGEDPAANA